FNTPLNVGGVDVTLRTGTISSLIPRVSVYNAFGQKVVTAVAVDPFEGGFVIHLNNVQPLTTYYIEVESGSQDVFGIGSYQLTIHELPLVNSLFGSLTATVTQGVTDTTTFLMNTLPTNDSFATAMNLQPETASSDAHVDYAYRGSISDSSD